MFNEAEFRAFVMSLLEEFNNSGGVVAVEFATSYEKLSRKRAILSESLAMIHPFTFNVKWTIFPCETCKGYHPNKPYHIMLEIVE